jgi:DNA invertase Pin-like site-specific DNA recombinase
MFQMVGVFAGFERAMIRERVLAGIARARDQGTQLGRRRLDNIEKPGWPIWSANTLR